MDKKHQNDDEEFFCDSKEMDGCGMFVVASFLILCMAACGLLVWLAWHFIF